MDASSPEFHYQRLIEYISGLGGEINPDDWRAEVVKRKHLDKHNCNRYDVMYVGPDGKKLRSKVEVAAALGLNARGGGSAPSSQKAKSATRGPAVPKEASKSKPAAVKLEDKFPALIYELDTDVATCGENIRKAKRKKYNTEDLVDKEIQVDEEDLKRELAEANGSGLEDQDL